MKSIKSEQEPAKLMTRNSIKFWIAVEAGLAVLFAWLLISDIRTDKSVWLISLDAGLIMITFWAGYDYLKKLKGGMYRDGKTGN